MKRYDVLVIGAGPGGYVAAIRAAQLGASAAVVEREYVGGVCLNIGCIPTKTLARNAEILHLARMGEKRGLNIAVNGLDMDAMLAAKDRIATQLSTGVRNLLKANGVDLYMGEAVAGPDKAVHVSGDAPADLEYGKLIAATGSRPASPPIPGLDSPVCLTSTELLALNRIPTHLVIIGGGVVGCEFASIFREFGSKVTLIEMMPRLLPGMDRDLSKILQQSFKKAGIGVTLETTVNAVRAQGEKAVVVFSSNGEQQETEADAILVSTGRVPNTTGLEALNLETERGFVKVDPVLRSSNPDVYAIGDVTGKLLLAHAASAMGIRAVENIMGDEQPMDFSLIPSCVYTMPEIGSVGLTEEEARERFGDVLIGSFPLAASGKALALGETTGTFKLVADPATHKLVGAHFIGAGSTELIAEATASIRMGATLADIGSTIHAHPTISECVMEAAHQAEGRAIHLPPPRKR